MDDDKKASVPAKANLAKEIKAMESQKRAQAMKSAPAPAVEQKVHFDGWYALRGQFIPKQHMKEILRADFNGRGLSDMESVARYDAALVKYGVRVK